MNKAYAWGTTRPSKLKQILESEVAAIELEEKNLLSKVSAFEETLRSQIEARWSLYRKRKQMLDDHNRETSLKPVMNRVRTARKMLNSLPREVQEQLPPEVRSWLTAGTSPTAPEGASGRGGDTSDTSKRASHGSTTPKTSGVATTAGPLVLTPTEAQVGELPAEPAGSGSPPSSHLTPLRPDYDEDLIEEMIAGRILVPEGYEMPISDDEIARREAEGLPVPRREVPWKPEVDPQAYDPDLLPDGPNGTKLRPDGYMIDAENHILNPKGTYVRGVPPGDEIDGDWRLAFVRPAPDTASDDPPPRPVSKKHLVRSHPAYVAVKKLEDDLVEFIYAHASHPINMDLRDELLIELNKITDFRGILGDAIEEERELPVLDDPHRFDVENVVGRLSRPLINPADAKAKAA